MPCLENRRFFTRNKWNWGFFKKIIEFTSGKRDFPFPVNEENFSKQSFKRRWSGKFKKQRIWNFEFRNFNWKPKKSFKIIFSREKEKILPSILPLKVNKRNSRPIATNWRWKRFGFAFQNSMFWLMKTFETKRFCIHLWKSIGNTIPALFFDEFQDTSALQWMNFLPLRDHNIATENSSFTLVGDPKQSIYRFRGGNAEIMLDIINKKDFSPIEVEIETLQQNFRSAKTLWNSTMNCTILRKLPEWRTRKIIRERCWTNRFFWKRRKRKVHFLENDLKEIYYQDCTEKMQKICKSASIMVLNLDITILCRGNNDIFNFSKLLET